MYELIILSLLARNPPDHPMSGYVIAKIINDIIGPMAKVSNGRLYPLLAKLEVDGLIVAIGTPGERRQRVYRITDMGRLRFRQLMLDTTSNPGEYKTIFWFKVPVLRSLKPDERFYLIDHYINYCQTHIFHLRNEMEDLKLKAIDRNYMSQPELDATLDAFHHYLRSWELELADTQRLRERMAAEAVAEETTTPNIDAQLNSKKKGS